VTSLGALLLAACAASNPEGRGPTVVRMPDERPAGTSESSPTEPEPTGDDATTGRRSPSTPSSETAGSDAALEPIPATADDRIGLPVAHVGGEPIDVRSFLIRAWWTSSDQQRDLLEQLILERIVRLEAERLRIRLDPDEVEAEIERVFESLDRRIRESGSVLTRPEYIRQVLRLDPAFWESQIRGDTIIQALLDRAVRAHSLANDHAIVRFLSVASDAEATGIEARLAAGESFADLAQELAERPGDGEATILVRNEDTEISRRVYGTAAGSWAGPWLSNGRYLFVHVERFVPAFEGGSQALLRTVEADLAAFPLHEIEFSQWHVAMNQRYSIDRTPYQDLVEGR